MLSGATQHYNKLIESKNFTNIKLNIAVSLIKIFKLGPLVSFNGSPTVSPTTAAACSLDPFPLDYPSTVKDPPSMNFLALSQAPPELDQEIAIQTPLTKIPGIYPAMAIVPRIGPISNGIIRTTNPMGANQLRLDLVAILIQAS